MILYVVIAQTGEEPDRSEWPVYCFKEEKAAQNYIIKTEPAARAIAAKYQKRYRECYDTVYKSIKSGEIHNFSDGISKEFWEKYDNNQDIEKEVDLLDFPNFAYDGVDSSSFSMTYYPVVLKGE